MSRREVSPQGTLVDFKEPVTIQGFFLGREVKQIPPNPKGWFYSVEDLEGQVWSFFGTKILNDKFGVNPEKENELDDDPKLLKIAIGEYVTVVFEGKTAQTKAGRTVKFFRVFVGQEDEGETAAAPEEEAVAL